MVNKKPPPGWGLCYKSSSENRSLLIAGRALAWTRATGWSPRRRYGLWRRRWSAKQPSQQGRAVVGLYKARHLWPRVVVWLRTFERELRHHAIAAAQQVAQHRVAAVQVLADLQFA